MKFIVIGAGQGGMQAAKTLALNGHDVIIFEKSSRENHCHDQLDVVEASLFTDLGIPVPEGTVKNFNPTFVAPYGDGSIFIDTPEEKRSWNIERKAFAKAQVEACEKAGVTMVFDTKVDSLIFDKDEVVGVKVEGEEIYAHLIIDSSGVNSPFRASFKGKCGITEKPKENQIFTTLHSYYSPAEGVEMPTEYKYYLNYCGLPGISWCGVETEGSVSTLIGKIGKITEEELNNATAQLRYENPIISDNLLRGGHRCEIPVRYPAPIMVAPGYASVGDCAFMTVPIMGNGIANAVRAGQMLAESIIGYDSVDMDALWQYNSRYFKEIGGVCCFLDCLKNALLASDNEDISYLLSSGIVKNEDIAAVMYGNIPAIEVQDIIERFKNIFILRRALGKVLEYIVKGADAFVVATKLIPENYDYTIYQWKYKLEKLFE